MRRLCPDAPGIAVLMVCAVVAAGCGSASPPGQSRGAIAVRGTCRDVAAVLSDGPDRGADPVGYAEAQVIPLRQIYTPGKSLRAAIDDLASAYRKFWRTNGSRAAKQAVRRADAKVNAICPGAAS
jgi:hypothetical protein